MFTIAISTICTYGMRRRAVRGYNAGQLYEGRGHDHILPRTPPIGFAMLVAVIPLRTYCTPGDCRCRVLVIMAHIDITGR